MKESEANRKRRLRERNRNPQLTVRVDWKLYTRVKYAAEEKEITVAEFLRRILQHRFRRKP